jgi:hypothetical protein
METMSSMEIEGHGAIEAYMAVNKLPNLSIDACSKGAHIISSRSTVTVCLS